MGGGGMGGGSGSERGSGEGVIGMEGCAELMSVGPVVGPVVVGANNAAVEVEIAVESVGV